MLAANRANQDLLLDSVSRELVNRSLRIKRIVVIIFLLVILWIIHCEENLWQVRLCIAYRQFSCDSSCV